MLLQIVSGLFGIAVLAYLSRRSLRQPGSHGFYRFFAWASILVLIILNLPHWFAQPFALHQCISWVLLLISLIPLLLGVVLLKRKGEPRGEVPGSANFAFENTTHLVTTGIYAYIRHPLYASLFYLAWGAYAKDPWSTAGILLVTAASVFLFLTARKEEQENIQSFGPGYQAYMKKTRRFIPYLF